MLPDTILSTYKQYKNDTQTIATWLFRTATKCGYTRDEPVKPTKLKGRARKLARDAAKATGSKNSTKYEVELREFVPMAEAIAKSNPEQHNVRVTTGLIKTFKRCIQARRGTSEWYGSQDQPVPADESHAFFTETLQKALQKLVPLHQLQELDRINFKLSELATEAAEKAAPSIKVENAYGPLHIEELDEAVLESTPSASTGPSTVASKEVRCTVKDNGEEWYFFMECFFADLHNIRGIVSSLWDLYTQGEIDVSTVAVVSNTAIDLVRRAEDDFKQSNIKTPEPWCFSQFDQGMCNLWFLETAFRSGKGQPEETREAIVPLSHWQEAEECFLFPYRYLNTHASHVSTSPGIPITRPAWLGVYDPSLDRETATPKQLYEQDAALLSDMLCTLLPYQTVGNTPNDDELFKGVYSDTLKGRTPTWLAFAAQLYIDAHDVLRTKSTQPFSDLYDFSIGARRTLRGHQKFVKKHDLVGYQSGYGDHRIKEIHDEIETWVMKDKMHQILDKEYGLEKQMQGNRKSGSKKTREWRSYEILKMHPVLPGMWKYCFHLQMQQEGLRLVNETQVMVVAHLYNALQQNGYLPEGCFWQDAEYLLQIHAEANTFLGERPKSIEDCTKRLALAQGVSPQTFAAGRRAGQTQRVVYSKSGGKILRSSTPVASVFTKRFVERGNVELSLANIEKILGKRMDARNEAEARHNKMVDTANKIKEEGLSMDTLEGFNEFERRMGWTPLTTREQWDEDQGEGEGSAGDTEAEATTASHDRPEARRSNGSSEEIASASDDEDDEAHDEVMAQWKATGTISITGFLQELADALEAEHLDLQFDYFGFHRQTRSLLEKIHTACLPMARNWVADSMIEILDTEEGPLVMPAVIMVAACDVTQSMNLFSLKRDLAVDDRGLKAAAEVMTEFIEREMGAREHGDDWEDEVADLAANDGLTSAVGKLEGLSIRESARQLKAVTAEDAWKRAKTKAKKSGKGAVKEWANKEPDDFLSSKQNEAEPSDGGVAHVEKHPTSSAVEVKLPPASQKTGTLPTNILGPVVESKACGSCQWLPEKNNMAAEIAEVSFERFLNGNNHDRRVVAEEIYDAFSTVGWVYVKDTGISQERVDDIFKLAKTFFDLPLESKLEWKLTDATINQGYTPDGAEGNGGIDHKECYEHRRFRNDLCPDETVLPGFRSMLDDFYQQCLSLGMSVLKCLAIALKLGDDYFDNITLRADPQMRLLHYPAIGRSVIEQEGHARIYPHTDFGLCTLLFQDSIGGLEVDPFHTGNFKQATPRPGTVLINIADLLQRLTNDRCKSTLHRVVSPKIEGDMLPARFSIPFFIHPDPETIIDPVTLSADEAKHYEPVNAGEWRIAHTTKDYKLGDAPPMSAAVA